MLFTKPVKEILISLLCLLSFLALTGCTSESRRFGVVFTNGFLDIYRIPDNTQDKIEQLTFTPTIREYPFLVSKNGDKIIFEVGLTEIIEEPSTSKIEERQQHVYILDTENIQIVDITSILVEYTVVPHDFSMDWSPDQNQFVVLTDEVDSYEINSFLEFIDYDGKKHEKILIPTVGEPPSTINSVNWAPDGKKFMLTQGVIGLEQQLQTPGSAILIYEFNSGEITQITEYKDNCLPREWSPTSRQIVATCSHGYYDGVKGISGSETVRIFDVENPGQPSERIAFSPCYDPSWSPDGKQIAFVCDKDKGYKGLFIVNSDGNDIHEVSLGNLENPTVLKTPIWSPDSSQIIYTAGNDFNSQNIYSIHLDNLSNHALTQQSGYYKIVAVYPIP